jgi:hypothetical protein
MSLEELSYESARFLSEQSFKRMLDLDQFRAAVRCGAFRPVRMRAGGVHFWIEGQLATKGKPRPEDCMVLCTSREKQHRYFRNPVAALELLWRMGARAVEIDMANWHPDHAKFARGLRPDMAHRLRFAHAYARSGSEGREVASDEWRESFKDLDQAGVPSDILVDRTQEKPEDREFDWPDE